MTKENNLDKNFFYNGDLKVEFLESIENKTSQKVSMYPLRGAKSTEELKGKDLHEMSRDEIGEVLASLSPSTDVASYNNLIRIEEYINWTVVNGYRSTNITPFQGLNRNEWAKQFTSKYQSSYFTREEILDMSKELMSYVDRAVLLLLFEGVSGKGYSEILNLRVKDMSKEGEQDFVTVYDSEKGSRTIPISSDLAQLIAIADRETEYTPKNGEGRTIQYEGSQFVFKKMRRGKQGGSLNNFFVLRKFIFFKDFFGLTYLSAKNIEDSGKMHMANVLHEEYGELTSEHLRKIGDQYNTPVTYSGSEPYRNITTIRRLIDTENFEKLYGYKLTFQNIRR